MIGSSRRMGIAACLVGLLPAFSGCVTMSQDDGRPNFAKQTYPSNAVCARCATGATQAYPQSNYPQAGNPQAAAPAPAASPLKQSAYFQEPVELPRPQSMPPIAPGNAPAAPVPSMTVHPGVPGVPGNPIPGPG